MALQRPFFKIQRRAGRGYRKHSDAKIAEVRQRLEAGETQASIARDLGMGESTVGQIKRGETHRLAVTEVGSDA